MRAYNYILTFLRLLLTVTAVNHWMLKNHVIIPKLESPFFMREPTDLPAFLSQIQNVDNVESSFTQLMQHREKIYEYLQLSVQYGKELVHEAKCAMEYNSLEKQLSYLTMSTAYTKRINLPNSNLITEHNDKPFCEKYAANVDDCVSIFENSENIEDFKISAEKNVTIGGKKYDGETLRRMSVDLLKAQPRSWKAHLLGSYYWRNKGEALEALKCACRAVNFASIDVKGIALLSFGTTLFRAGCFDDAEVILEGAMELDPEGAEIHFSLATALAMKHDFNRSLKHFDISEFLDPNLSRKSQPMRNFISCLQNLNKKTAKMNTYVEFIRNEVRHFKTLKQNIRRQNEALMHQQVPLGARTLSEFPDTDEMRKRGQYCSMRKLSLSEEPVLFCDFFSELQVKLESQDLDISTLERDLKTTSEAVIKQVSKDLGTKLPIYHIDDQTSNSFQKQSLLASTRSKKKNIRRY